jgi:hypothetical protein
MAAKKNFDSLLVGYKNNRERMKKDPTFPIFELGYETGKREVADLIHEHLMDKYISGIDRPERGSPEAKALLGLATELTEKLKAIQA